MRVTNQCTRTLYVLAIFSLIKCPEEILILGMVQTVTIPEGQVAGNSTLSVAHFYLVGVSSLFLQRRSLPV